MFRIVKKEVLSPKITLLEIEAPYIARKAQPGQFIIFRIDEKGERCPLTPAGYDREKGTITIIFQRAGLTTMALAAMEEGDALMDLVGPLGLPTEMEGVKKACVVGGGVGCAIAYPIANGLNDAALKPTSSSASVARISSSWKTASSCCPQSVPADRGRLSGRTGQGYRQAPGSPGRRRKV